MLFSFTLAANADTKINLSGNAFYVHAATSPLEFRVDGAGAVVRRGGQGAERDEMFGALFVKNLAGAPNVIELEVYMVDTWRLVSNVVASHPVAQDAASSPWSVEVVGRDSLGGDSANVTSSAAVLRLAAGAAGKARDVDVRPVGGAIYIADDNTVGAANGKLVQDGEVCSLKDYIGAVYAKALTTDAVVYVDQCYRA